MSDSILAINCPDYVAMVKESEKPEAPWYETPDLPEPLKTIVSVIQEKSRDDMDLNQLANEHGTDVEELTRLFLNYLGASPEEYQEKVRLNHAQHLLEETLWSLKQVADETGFKDTGTLQTAFLEKIGMFPSRYK